jgi:hypothetical protein
MAVVSAGQFKSLIFNVIYHGPYFSCHGLVYGSDFVRFTEGLLEEGLEPDQKLSIRGGPPDSKTLSVLELIQRQCSMPRRTPGRLPSSSNSLCICIDIPPEKDMTGGRG